jgi:uncharacterized protein Usg
MSNDEFTKISERAWRKVATQAEAISIEPPPPRLEEYAKEVGIAAVCYKELISDAGLLEAEEGYHIVINTEYRGQSLPSGTSASAADGSWARFQPWLRRTVAHEIAHAYFIRVAEEARGSDLLEDHRPDVEQACHILARLILLPRRGLMRDMKDGPLNVENIHRLTTAFRVSPEIFIRRLYLSDVSDFKTPYPNLNGFVSFVRRNPDGRFHSVASHLFGSLARQRFDTAIRVTKRIVKYPNLSRQYHESAWKLDSVPLTAIGISDMEPFLLKAASQQVDKEIDWADGDVIPCKITTRQIHESPLGFLLSLEILGPPQKRGQRMLF